ncbi:unnamed protein product [Ascophyllum nodosum]
MIAFGYMKFCSESFPGIRSTPDRKRRESTKETIIDPNLRWQVANAMIIPPILVSTCISDI